MNKRELDEITGKGGFEILDAGETFTGEAVSFIPQGNATFTEISQNDVSLGGNYLTNTYISGIPYPAKGYFTSLTLDGASDSIVVYLKN